MGPLTIHPNFQVLSLMFAVTPLLTALTIAGAAGALAQRVGAASTAFVLAGDSTTYLNGGWGPGFCADLAAGIPCVITAFSGETTGSFFADGRWNQTLDALRTNLQAGRRTFVTMQFGCVFSNIPALASIDDDAGTTTKK